MDDSEIADHFGLTKQAIHNRLHRAGIERRLRGARPPVIEHLVLNELYLKEQLSVEKVADRLGTTLGRINHWLKVYRISRRRRGTIPRHPELETLAIGEAVDLPVPHRKKNPHAIFHQMAKRCGIRVSTRRLNETTMRVTRKA